MADNSSFIEKLRMNNIFPSEGLPNPLIGMPNFTSGRQIPVGFDNQSNQQPRLQQIAQQSAKPTDPYGATFDVNGRAFKDINGKIQGGAPMNYAYDAPKSDEYGTQILMGNTEADKQRKAKELLGIKDQAAQGGLAIKQQLADVAKFKAQNPNLKPLLPKGGNVMLYDPLTGKMHDTGIDTGTLSDQDKLELTGDNQINAIGARGDVQKSLQDTKGNQALEQISSRIAGQKDINANKTAKPPTEYAPARNMNTRVKAQQLMTDRPDLAQYLSIDQNGRANINPNTPLNELTMIQSALYPKGTQQDINLPSATPNKAPAKSTKPTAADLIKKYGG